MTSHPNSFFAATGFGLALACTFFLGATGGCPTPLCAWLVAMTLVNFCMFGYDKAVAGSGRTRVPERVLLALTLAGGTAGALLAMALFHHKTIKAPFRFRMALVAGLQVVFLLAVFRYGEHF